MNKEFTKMGLKKEEDETHKKTQLNIFQGFRFSETAMYISLWLILLIYIVLLSTHQVKAQAVVSVGGGSYAEYPPASLGAAIQNFALASGLNVPDTNTRAIPTNDWWTYVLQNNLGGDLWAYPALFNTANYGFQLYFPNNTNWAGGDMYPGIGMKIRGVGFNATRQIAKDWSDWMVVLNLTSGTASMDITSGHGLPMVWTETKGVYPQLDFSKNTVSFFNDAGATITMPQTTDHIGILYGGKYYGVFVPDNTVLSLKDSLLTATYASGSTGFIVVSLMPAAASLPEMAKYAFAIPRKTTVNWNYRPGDGKIDVSWNIQAQNLKGQANTNVIQGFIPHHYKRAVANFAFNGMEYGVVNGKMKCGVGNTFGFTYDFNGILPVMPAPKVQNIPNPFNPAILDQQVANYAGKTAYRNDTYYGGKDLVSYVAHAFVAKNTGHANYNTLKNTAENALTDWFTYTPGESNHYFARYAKWGALVGFGNSFGSENFTDNHFHYGYHTYAAALMGMMDPAWLDKYGDMAKQVAKQYANWDRSDKRFPMFRTFDPWTGHSWAGGTSAATGNNQESTSEAMQSWAGIFLLGSNTNDIAMRDAGAFGFLSESRATMEYWFDWDRSNFPTTYGHTMASRVFAGAVNYGTWFGGQSLYVHAIQYLPWGPHLNFLAQDTAYARSEFNVLRNETKASNAEISSYGSDWSNVVLSYAQMFDPAYVTKKLDYYYNAPSTTNTDTSRYATMHDYAPVATDTRFSGALTYYNTHSNRTLGWVQWNYHISIPSSCTYYNPFTKVYSHVVFNPSKTTQLASVYNGATLVGSYNVPPQTTVTFTLPNPITSIGISKPYKTVALGGTVQLTGKGFDQYGAIYPLTGISWSVSGGGTIDQNGLFTSTSSLYPVIVTAKALGFTATDTLRSGSPSVLTTLVISPAMVSIPTNVTQQFTVSAKDQFGDPYTPVGAVWSASNGGVINGNGMFTAGNTGGLYEIKLTRGNVIAGALVAVKATPTNLALNKPATASTTNGVNNAAAGVDGNAGTRWESAAADNQTFSVDLQNTFDLTRIVLIWEAAYAKTYDVQVSSDGVTYTTIYSQFTGNGKTEDFPVSGTAKYVRIKCNQRATNYGFSFYELQVYGYPSPPTVVPSNIIIVPSTVSINTGGTRQFNAYGFDANYNAASISGGTWAINGGGTVNASGLVNATTFGGPFSINYASGSLTGNGSFSVSSNAMDCAGVQGGTAYYDACNKCAGGTTGVTPQSDPGKCIITHIVNNDLLINMTLYPNPFEGSFTIDVSEKTGTFEIVMTDLNGRVVYKSLVENPSEEIHLGSDLNAGMYFVKITSGSDYKNFKMVKF